MPKHRKYKGEQKWRKLLTQEQKATHETPMIIPSNTNASEWFDQYRNHVRNRQLQTPLESEFFWMMRKNAMEKEKDPLCDTKLDRPYSDWDKDAPIRIPTVSKDLQLEQVFQDWHGKKDSSDCCLQLKMCRLKPNRTIVVLNLLHRQLETFMCQRCGESRTKLVIFFHACEQYRSQYHAVIHSVLDNLILKDIRLLIFEYCDQPTFVFKDNVSSYIK